MEKIVEASEQELAVCPGIGPQKASWHFCMSDIAFTHVYVELNIFYAL